MSDLNVSLISKGHLLSFSEAIDFMAARKFPELWRKPIAHDRARRLPQLCSDALTEEKFYAAIILVRRDPDLVIPEIYDTDDSIPSHLRRHGPEPDIEPGLWEHARLVADQTFDHESGLHKMLLCTLNEFASLAFNREIVVRAVDRQTGIPDDLYGAHWMVDEAELRARYSSSQIVARDGQRSRVLQIVVEKDKLEIVVPAPQIDYAERREAVRQGLQKAMKDKNFPPYGTTGVLYQKIAKYLACSKKEAASIVQQETGGCWSGRGRRKRSDQTRVNQVIIVLDEA